MNCELVVFVIFCQLCCIVKFDTFTDIVSVSGVTVFDFVSDEKYENGNGFSVYRPFSSLPTMTTQPKGGRSFAFFLQSTVGPSENKQKMVFNFVQSSLE
jgi:hypothetical protein